LTVAPALLLVGRTIANAVTEANGSLELTFSNGASVRCEPAETHEAWEVVGGSPHYLVVCVKGGGVAVFGETHPRAVG
jgi:Family of unknown function (DUF6188)